MQLIQAVLSLAVVFAWLAIPSALAGLALHAYECQQQHRRVIEQSRRARHAHSNMAQEDISR